MLKDVPTYLLNITDQVVSALLLEINVPDEEMWEFSEQIKERRMGRLFANFESYDVQATRRQAREEEIEQGIRRLVQVDKKHGCIPKEAEEDLGGGKNSTRLTRRRRPKR